MTPGANGTPVTNGTSGSLTSASSTPFDQWMWQPQPKAQAIVNELSAAFLAKCPQAATLAKRMKMETGTRFNDWIDTIGVRPGHVLASSPGGGGGTIEQRMADAGYVKKPVPGCADHYVCELGMFPSIVLCPKTPAAGCIEIKVDSVADFLSIWGLSDVEIMGAPLTPLRMAMVFKSDDAEMGVIERHGYRGYAEFTAASFPPAKSITWVEHLDRIRRRPRDLEGAAGWESLNRIIDAAIADLGRDLTCDLFFEGERQYWMRRNRAARVQKERQDRLGVGWANHDHHTYRCSREDFPRLVALWEKLGMHCRERFYAGGEAGWGAQVMEQPVTGIITFNDVDMTPEELMGDFSHKGFAEKHANGKLGTVGLWCALHGEAVFAAGMHHLECQFDWHALKEQLESEASVKMMDPFTTYPYLRQAFTEGERWKVSEKRIQRLVDQKLITAGQAEVFRKEGAVGSHLENLERNDGFKGFNQKGVSDIIARTDPRKLVGAGGA